MQLVWLAMLAFCCQSASGMHMNVVNLRQQEATHEHSFCELHANTSAAAQEICALIMDPFAAAQFEAYGDMSIDEQADFHKYNALHSDLAQIDNIRKLLAEEQLLENLRTFRKVRERQRSKATPPSKPTFHAFSSSSKRKGDIRTARTCSALLFLITIFGFLIVYSACGFAFACWGLVIAQHQDRHSRKEGCIDVNGIRHREIAKYAERTPSKEVSSSEYCMDKCGKAFVAIVAVFFVIRTFLRIHNNDVFQTSLASFANCGREWCLVAAAAMLVVYLLGVMRSRSPTEIKLEHVDGKKKVKKRCATCGCYSCYIRH
jgi:hypothetical protein